MAARLLVVAVAANVALAYSGTFPVVAWSSSQSTSLESSPLRIGHDFHGASVLNSILQHDDICGHDAIILINHPGAHASDLRALSPHGHISRSLTTAKNARQYPYVPSHYWHSVLEAAEDVSQRCGSRLLHFSPGDSGVTLESSRKHVVCMDMPHLHQSGKERKLTMNEHESMLANELSALSHAFPNHLVVYSGAHLRSSPAFQRRQAPDVPARPVLDLSAGTQRQNTTLPKGGILKRYQLLTPELLTVLLVTLFVLLPVALLGMKALASIQNPIRLEPPKDFDAREKKNQ